MDRHVQAPINKLLFDFLDEHPQAHAGQGRGLVSVAVGGDGLYLKLQVWVDGTQALQDQVGLQAGQGAGPGAHPHDVRATLTGLSPGRKHLEWGRILRRLR